MPVYDIAQVQIAVHQEARGECGPEHSQVVPCADLLGDVSQGRRQEKSVLYYADLAIAHPSEHLAVRIVHHSDRAVNTVHNDPIDVAWRQLGSQRGREESVEGETEEHVSSTWRTVVRSSLRVIAIEGGALSARQRQAPRRSRHGRAALFGCDQQSSGGILNTTVSGSPSISRTVVTPKSLMRSKISRSSVSGAEAPAVTPICVLPSNHSALT